MKTELVCPQCGEKFQIAEEEYMAIGKVLAKNSNMGTVYMPLEGQKSKVRQRLEAMKAAGIDTTNYFALRNEQGEETDLCCLTCQGVQRVNEDDPIVQKIIDAGSIRNAHLFKQHVMAQMFKYIQYYGSIHNAIKNFSYKYSWQVLNDMLARQSAMYRHNDGECYAEDNRWYNKELAMRMINEYIDGMHTMLIHARQHSYKHTGKKYVKFTHAKSLLKNGSNKGLFTEDIDKFINACKSYATKIKNASNPVELHRAVEAWVKVMPKPEMSYIESHGIKVKISEHWINAFKGYGAYFTLQNLIRFHGCKFLSKSKDESLANLNEYAETYKGEAYWLVGLMNDTIRVNDFDIAAKRTEWRKQWLNKH